MLYSFRLSIRLSGVRGCLLVNKSFSNIEAWKFLLWGLVALSLLKRFTERPVFFYIHLRTSINTSLLSPFEFISRTIESRMTSSKLARKYLASIKLISQIEPYIWQCTRPWKFVLFLVSTDLGGLECNCNLLMWQLSQISPSLQFFRNIPFKIGIVLWKVDSVACPTCRRHSSLRILETWNPLLARRSFANISTLNNLLLLHSESVNTFSLDNWWTVKLKSCSFFIFSNVTLRLLSSMCWQISAGKLNQEHKLLFSNGFFSRAVYYSKSMNASSPHYFQRCTISDLYVLMSCFFDTCPEKKLFDDHMCRSPRFHILIVGTFHHVSHQLGYKWYEKRLSFSERLCGTYWTFPFKL